VVTEQVAAQAVTLNGLAGRLATGGELIAMAGDAAADTAAAGALHSATSAWIQALSQYADATHSLASAVALAAECYAATDAGVVPGG
jgi:hypothetical protein